MLAAFSKIANPTNPESRSQQSWSGFLRAVCNECGVDMDWITYCRHQKTFVDWLLQTTRLGRYPNVEIFLIEIFIMNIISISIPGNLYLMEKSEEDYMLATLQSSRGGHRQLICDWLQSLSAKMHGHWLAFLDAQQKSI